MANVLSLHASLNGASKSNDADQVQRGPSLPLVVDARRLAQLLCVGIRTVRCWDSSGKLPAPLRIGGRVVWRVDEIQAWLESGAPDREKWSVRRASGSRMIAGGCR